MIPKTTRFAGRVQESLSVFGDCRRQRLHAVSDRQLVVTGKRGSLLEETHQEEAYGQPESAFPHQGLRGEGDAEPDRDQREHADSADDADRCCPRDRFEDATSRVDAAGKERCQENHHRERDHGVDDERSPAAHGETRDGDRGSDDAQAVFVFVRQVAKDS